MQLFRFRPSPRRCSQMAPSERELPTQSGEGDFSFRHGFAVPPLSKRCLNHHIYIHANAVKVGIDLFVCKTDHFQTILFKDFCSKSILFSSFLRSMLRSINFYNQPCLVAIKVCDKMINTLLSLKPNLIITQKFIPKTVLLRRGVFPHRPRQRNVFLVIFHRHCYYLLLSCIPSDTASLFMAPSERELPT